MSATATTTKERILDAAEEIMLQKSFHSVGLNEILTAVKVPKDKPFPAKYGVVGDYMPDGFLPQQAFPFRAKAQPQET